MNKIKISFLPAGIRNICLKFKKGIDWTKVNIFLFPPKGNENILKSLRNSLQPQEGIIRNSPKIHFQKHDKKETSHLHANDWFEWIEIHFLAGLLTRFYSHSIVAGGLELMS